MNHTDIKVIFLVQLGYIMPHWLVRELAKGLWVYISEHLLGHTYPPNMMLSKMMVFRKSFQTAWDAGGKVEGFSA